MLYGIDQMQVDVGLSIAISVTVSVLSKVRV